MDPIIRYETLEDMTAIENVTIKAFLNAPHSDHNEQFIVATLRDSDALSISLVAEIEGEIIGHIAVSPMTISDGTTGWFGLGPISVEPNYQRSGIGSRLMQKVLEQLITNGANGCVLLGDPAYYSRFGFKPVSDLILPGVPPEFFQAISFCGTLPEGEVSYHDAFNLKN